MARLDELINQIADPQLRAELRGSIRRLRRSRNFGLVFEEHVPENALLPGYPISPGTVVQRRTQDSSDSTFTVRSIQKRRTIVVDADGAEQKVSKSDLLAVKRFGDPIYPVLEPLGRVVNGAADRAHHAVLRGENFHALQLFGSSQESVQLWPV